MLHLSQGFWKVSLSLQLQTQSGMRRSLMKLMETETERVKAVTAREVILRKARETEIVCKRGREWTLHQTVEVETETEKEAAKNRKKKLITAKAMETGLGTETLGETEV
mmetsp:Transcript_20923/g.41738  ORF Transcript_20923/g.41738 Transcript_20923/m.41738 type:complete len:109 (-) Transcript_20923:2633-2959(-)